MEQNVDGVSDVSVLPVDEAMIHPVLAESEQTKALTKNEAQNNEQHLTKKRPIAEDKESDMIGMIETVQ